MTRPKQSTTETARAYPGLARTARDYWKAYVTVFASAAVLFGLTGVAIALALDVRYPTAVPLVGITVASLVVHIAVLYVRDVWAGEYNPDRTQVTSSRSRVAMVLISVAFAAVFIGLGTLAGLAAAAVDVPHAAAIAATYYPVCDLLGLRRGLWTPGSIVLAGVAVVLSSLLDVRRTVFDSLPVIGTRRGPHF